MITFDQNIPAEVMKSPALLRQSELYPKRYQGKVPMKIRMLKTVTADVMFIALMSEVSVAVQENVYWCWVNSHGAVAVVFPDGSQLGVKPDEFEVSDFHDIMK